MNGLVTVAVFGQPHELAVVRARLESEGIFCHAQDEHTVAAHPFYSHLVGGIKLQVRPEDAAQALEILNEAGLGDDPDPLEPEMTEADVDRDPPSPLISEKMGKRLGLLALALIALAIILLA